MCVQRRRAAGSIVYPSGPDELPDGLMDVICSDLEPVAPEILGLETL